MSDRLSGRRLLITGVSRTAGIGHAIACRAAEEGASLFLAHYGPHDAAQPWGSEPLEQVLESVRAHLQPGAVLAEAQCDLSQPEAPAQLAAQAADALGGLDGLVCNHALSGSDGTLAELSPADFDAHWAVNARASLLLTQAFQEQVAAQPPREGVVGSVVLMTSGQGMGPMPDEIAYATSKAALAGITPSLAAGLAERGIRLNTVNPGPVNTGYMSQEAVEALTPAFPFGFPTPADPARLICWLLSDEAGWVTGQVINTEGGFRRS